MSVECKLKEAGITKAPTGQCSCGGNKFVYSLPVKLDIEIVEYLKDFGETSFDFKTSHILRIETATYAITGIRRLKEIRFIEKTESKNIQALFEENLVLYINSKK